MIYRITWPLVALAAVVLGFALAVLALLVSQKIVDKIAFEHFAVFVGGLITGGLIPFTQAWRVKQLKEP